MEALKELNNELGQPSQAKLLQAARKRGLKVTAAQVKEVVQAGSTREIFAKPQQQRGHHATESESAHWQADLIDFKQFKASSNKDNKYALSVTNVFDRKTHTEALSSKKPQEVWQAFEKILGKFGSRPSKLSTDNGEEWGGAFAEGAKAKGIVLQGKLSDPNAIAVSDAAVAHIKKTLFRDMASKDSTTWADKLPKAERAYNETPHQSTMGEAPKDVKDSDVVRFRLLQENAEKLRGNAKQLDQRQAKMKELGYFRPMLGTQSFQRGFKPRFSGTVLKADSVEGGTVISGGKRYELARVLPVSASSKAVAVPKALAQGSEARSAKQASELATYKNRLRDFVKDGPKGISAVGTYLRTLPGFEQKLTELRLNRPGGMRTAIKATDPSLQIDEGRGQPMVRRRRLVGKQ